MALIRTVKGYATSTDYRKLWELAQRQSVVCLVQHQVQYRWATGQNSVGGNLMDVAQTIAMPDDSGKVWCIDISCRGSNYVQGFGIDDFAEQCQRANVQWLVPQEDT